MALTVDRFDLFLQVVVNRFRPVRDTLLIFGTFYGGKLVLKCANVIYKSVKTFGIPLFWPRNFTREYGSWIIITGCGTDIGKSYAFEFARRGLNLIILSSNKKELEQLENELKTNFDIRIEALHVDVFDHTNTLMKIQSLVLNKNIGIVVNNLEFQPSEPISFNEEPIKTTLECIQSNVTFTTNLTKIVLPAMETNRKGAIILVSSLGCLFPRHFHVIHAASHNYLSFLWRGLHGEYRRKGITFQILYPGSLSTEDARNKNWNIFKPSPSSYVNSSIRTLGFASETTGYLPFSLISLLPLRNAWIAKYVT